MRSSLRRVIPVVAVCALATGMHAAPFTPGNIAVLRVGGFPLNNSSFAVDILEYTPTGSLVQTISLPFFDAPPHESFTISGTTAGEGMLARSLDGKWLTCAGYDASAFISSIATTSASTYPRVVARIDTAAGVDTSTVLTGAFDNASARAAYTTNGTDIWAIGSTQGVQYTTIGSTSSPATATTGPLLRMVLGFGPQLHGGGPANGVVTLGTGYPTSFGGVSFTGLPGWSGFPASLSTYGFDWGSGTQLWCADSRPLGTGGGLQKVDFDGTNWNLTATYEAPAGVPQAPRAIAVDAANGKVFCVAIPTLTSSILGSFDMGTGTWTTLASASGNQAFRGVALVPSANQPTVALASAANGTVTAIATFSVAATLSTAPASGQFTAADVAATNGATVSNFSGAGINWSFDVTMTAIGDTVMSIPGGGFVEPTSSIWNAASNDITVTMDAPPTPVLTSGDAAITNADPLHVHVHFDVPMTGFDPNADVFITGGINAGGGSGSGREYDVFITPSGNGVVTAQVLANVAQTPSLFSNLTSAIHQWTYDGTPPVSAFSQPVPSFGVGDAIELPWTSSDIGTTVTSVTYYDRAEPGPWFSEFPLTPVTSGTLTYSPFTAGRYYFATVATDTAGNAQTAPSGTGSHVGAVSYIWNNVPNGDITITFPAGAGPVVRVPMENTPFAGIDIDLGNVTTTGTLTFSRAETDGVPPLFDKKLLLDDITTITAGGLLAFPASPGAAITLHYQEANLDTLTEAQINRVFREDAGVVTTIIPDLVDTSANTVTFHTPGFSTFYIGNSAAAPGGVADWMQSD